MQKLPSIIAVGLTLGGLVAVQASSGPSEPTLGADQLTLSVLGGGKQDFLIDAGPAYGGFSYLVSGSTSGIFPGTVRDSVAVPLNIDDYSVMLQSAPDPAIFKSFYGRLDKLGQANPSIHLPEGIGLEGLVGSIFYHSVVVLDPKTKAIVAATNAVELLLLP